MKFTKDQIARFWSKVDKTGDCWLWTGAPMVVGYGVLGVITRSGKRNITAHRISYILAYGRIPKNQCVCHKCDVRLCVNPKHLFVGTIADNNRDMISKGRAARGDRLSRKITSDDVRKIRALRGQLTQASIAQEYEVHPSMISLIMSNKRWKNAQC